MSHALECVQSHSERLHVYGMGGKKTQFTHQGSLLELQAAVLCFLCSALLAMRASSRVLGRNHVFKGHFGLQLKAYVCFFLLGENRLTNEVILYVGSSVLCFRDKAHSLHSCGFKQRQQSTCIKNNNWTIV